MEKSKQLQALACLETKRYIIKGDKVFNRNGKEMFKYSLPSGYIQCTLFNGKRKSGKIKVIIYKHNLIYLANFGLFDGSLVIAHKDCNNANNHPSNLVAVSQSENVLMSKNSRKDIILKRLTTEQIETIKQLSKEGLNQSAISRTTGINRTVVRYHLL